jgi:hypothetical protein
MIRKITLQSIINKYYLGENESAKWIVKNNKLIIDFISLQRDIVGKIECDDIVIPNCELNIFNTKKLLNLVNTCSGDLMIDVETNGKDAIRLKISDVNFDLSYMLAESSLIGKVPTVDDPSWDAKLEITHDDINNLIKAHNAVSDSDNMFVYSFDSKDKPRSCKFTFGNDMEYNNNITYQIGGEVTHEIPTLTFSSNAFKNIMSVNKDMKEGFIFINNEGLMKISFTTGDKISSTYYIVRKA